MLRILPALLLAFALPKATIPTADKPGTRDNPILKRYEGSFIVFSERKSFAELTLPLSRLEEVPDKKVGNNNRAHEPKNKRSLEGAYTRLVYLAPAERSPLEVLRNYQDEIRAKGGKILFECKGAECGGDPERSSGGGGGDASLAMYLYPADRITEPHGSNGYCAMAEHITDQRYTAAEIPSTGAHVSVLTYTIFAPDKHDPCLGFNSRTVAVVDILEAKAREQKMVTVNASEMASAIAGTGKVALYGIYFDFNKTDIKPESDATLGEIGKLLKGYPAMKVLVVGHTDNVGTFVFNTDLSQRRAAAVVNVLASRFGIARERLTPFGVSFAAPVASNRTEEGRAKNRRVELVENAPSK
jgi:outer membrane protein OmpA-like peptidoglycan-associated protein